MHTTSFWNGHCVLQKKAVAWIYQHINQLLPHERNNTAANFNNSVLGLHQATSQNKFAVVLGWGVNHNDNNIIITDLLLIHYRLSPIQW